MSKLGGTRVGVGARPGTAAGLGVGVGGGAWLKTSRNASPAGTPFTRTSVTSSLRSKATSPPFSTQKGREPGGHQPEGADVRPPEVQLCQGYFLGVHRLPEEYGVLDGVHRAHDDGAADAPLYLHGVGHADGHDGEGGGREDGVLNREPLLHRTFC